MKMSKKILLITALIFSISSGMCLLSTMAYAEPNFQITVDSDYEIDFVNNGSILEPTGGFENPVNNSDFVFYISNSAAFTINGTLKSATGKNAAIKIINNASLLLGSQNFIFNALEESANSGALELTSGGTITSSAGSKLTINSLGNGIYNSGGFLDLSKSQNIDINAKTGLHLILGNTVVGDANINSVNYGIYNIGAGGSFIGGNITISSDDIGVRIAGIGDISMNSLTIKKSLTGIESLSGVISIDNDINIISSTTGISNTNGVITGGVTVIEAFDPNNTMGTGIRQTGSGSITLDSLNIRKSTMGINITAGSLTVIGEIYIVSTNIAMYSLGASSGGVIIGGNTTINSESYGIFISMGKITLASLNVLNSSTGINSTGGILKIVGNINMLSAATGISNTEGSIAGGATTIEVSNAIGLATGTGISQAGGGSITLDSLNIRKSATGINITTGSLTVIGDINIVSTSNAINSAVTGSSGVIIGGNTTISAGNYGVSLSNGRITLASLNVLNSVEGIHATGGSIKVIGNVTIFSSSIGISNTAGLIKGGATTIEVATPFGLAAGTGINQTGSGSIILDSVAIRQSITGISAAAGTVAISGNVNITSTGIGINKTGTGELFGGDTIINAGSDGIKITASNITLSSLRITKSTIGINTVGGTLQINGPIFILATTNGIYSGSSGKIIGGDTTINASTYGINIAGGNITLASLKIVNSSKGIVSTAGAIKISGSLDIITSGVGISYTNGSLTAGKTSIYTDNNEGISQTGLGTITLDSLVIVNSSVGINSSAGTVRVMEETNISSLGYGIKTSSDSTVILGSLTINGGGGILASNSSTIRISEGLNIVSAGYGIYLEDAASIAAGVSTISSNSGDGIHMEDTAKMSLSSLTLTKSSRGIYSIGGTLDIAGDINITSTSVGISNTVGNISGGNTVIDVKNSGVGISHGSTPGSGSITLASLIIKNSTFGISMTGGTTTINGNLNITSTDDGIENLPNSNPDTNQDTPSYVIGGHTIINAGKDSYGIEQKGTNSGITLSSLYIISSKFGISSDKGSIIVPGDVNIVSTSSDGKNIAIISKSSYMSFGNTIIEAGLGVGIQTFNGDNSNITLASLNIKNSVIGMELNGGTTTVTGNVNILSTNRGIYITSSASFIGGNTTISVGTNGYGIYQTSSSTTFLKSLTITNGKVGIYSTDGFIRIAEDIKIATTTNGIHNTKGNITGQNAIINVLFGAGISQEGSGSIELLSLDILLSGNGSSANIINLMEGTISIADSIRIIAKENMGLTGIFNDKGIMVGGNTSIDKISFGIHQYGLGSIFLSSLNITNANEGIRSVGGIIDITGDINIFSDEFGINNLGGNITGGKTTINAGEGIGIYQENTNSQTNLNSLYINNSLYGIKLMAGKIEVENITNVISKNIGIDVLGGTITAGFVKIITTGTDSIGVKITGLGSELDFELLTIEQSFTGVDVLNDGSIKVGHAVLSGDNDALSSGISVDSGTVVIDILEINNYDTGILAQNSSNVIINKDTVIKGTPSALNLSTGSIVRFNSTSTINGSVTIQTGSSLIFDGNLTMNSVASNVFNIVDGGNIIFGVTRDIIVNITSISGTIFSVTDTSNLNISAHNFNATTDGNLIEVKTPDNVEFNFTKDSNIVGKLFAETGSMIYLILNDISRWTGYTASESVGAVNISISDNAKWYITGNSVVNNMTLGTNTSLLYVLGTDENKYHVVNVNSLSGTGNIHMNVSLVGETGIGDRLIINSAQGEYYLTITSDSYDNADQIALVTVKDPNTQALFTLRNTDQQVDIGAYKYKLISELEGANTVWSLIRLNDLSEGFKLSLGSVVSLYNHGISLDSAISTELQKSYDGFWGAAFYQNQTFNANEFFDKFTQHVAGGILGYSMPVNNVNLGGLLGYTYSLAKYPIGSSSTISSFTIGAYANYDSNNLRMNAYGRFSIYTQKTIILHTDSTTTLANLLVPGWSFGFEVGYKIRKEGSGFFGEPIVKISYSDIADKPYSYENLKVSNRTYSGVTTWVGGRIGNENKDLKGNRFNYYLELGWVHNSNGVLTVEASSDNPAGLSYQIDKNRFEAGVGFVFTTNSKSKLSINYKFSYGEKMIEKINLQVGGSFNF